MKKTTITCERKDGSIEDKKITKNVSGLLNQVEAIISSAKTCHAVFNHQALSYRMKLREACEKAISLKNTVLIQKMEEIIWRKVYYDPLATSKKLRKGTSWSDSECGIIWAHLNEGIAFYHQYLMNIVTSNGICTSHFAADLLPSFINDHNSHDATSQPQYMVDTFFRSLTCLGDLARYMLDLPCHVPISSTSLISVRYYQQALHFNCESGLTHSNLATVYSLSGNHLMAAVHYLRSITCEKPFSAAENSLKRLMDKSRSWLVREKLTKDSTKEVSLEKKSTAFLHAGFSLLSCFLSDRKMEEIALLCQEVLVQLGKLLDDYDNVEPPDCSETSSENSGHVRSKITNGFIDSSSPFRTLSKSTEESDYIFLLNPDTMVAQCSMFILCVKHLQRKESVHCNMSQVLLVSILLTLVSHINTRLEQRFILVDPSFTQTLLPIEETNVKVEPQAEIEKEENEKKESLVNGTKKSKKSRLSKLRRKKKGQSSEEDDSEEEHGSEDEGNNFDCVSDHSSCEDDHSLNGEEGVVDSLLCSSEDEESDEDVKIEDCEGGEEEWRGMTAEEHLQLVEQEEMLAAVHILLHWLQSNEDMIKMCGKAADNLWISLAKLFNLTNVDFGSINTEECNGTRKDILNKLKEVDVSCGSVPMNLNGQCSSLPESLMLSSILPELQHISRSGVGSADIYQMNLLRLLELKKLILDLIELPDVPLTVSNTGIVVKSETKMKELMKSKNEDDSTILDNGIPSGDSHTSSKATTKVHLNKDGGTPNNSSPGFISRSSQKQFISNEAKMISSMQNLTAQWLQHEVRNLERKINNGKSSGAGPCGLYLVPDASVLVHCLPVVKTILASPSFVVIIPQIVIDSLDYQKRESIGARNAIRWLESKLRHGSRFMRTQRTHERTHIPFVKYPKRKEKEAWEWIHLVECSHYLSAQMTKSDPKTSTVSILTTDTSIKIPKTNLSLKTLAEAAGCSLISVEDLVKKWQKKSSSTKGPG